jgi:DNA repair photolyase
MGAVRVARPQLALPLEPPSRELPVLDQRSRGTRFLSLPVRRVLNPPAATGMQFWSLNPYIGCEFGCSYCYARQTHAWTMERSGRPEAELSPHLSFERNILVKHSAPEVLLRTLDPSRLGNTALVIGTATDPYQPAERKFRLTRRLLETLLHHRGLHIGIITKSPLIARDVDVLTAVAERHQLSVHLSIASTDAELLRRLEARTPAPHARFRALSRLTAAGIPAGVLIAPIIPGITDSYTALAAIMEAAREAGARWVAGEALRLGHAARTGFLPLLRREFPELVARYQQRYGRSQRAGKDYEKALTRRLVTLQQAFGFPVSEGMRRKAEVSEPAT